MTLDVATHSPQMANLLARYGVETERKLVAAIQREHLEMTGIALGKRAAEATLDSMLEAEYQRIEGGAYDTGLIPAGFAGHGSHTAGRFCFECDRLGSPQPWAEPTREEHEMTNPIDALPDEGDPRSDPRLNDVAFIATEEGQALLQRAQDADKEARRVAKNAAEKARRDRIKQAKADGLVPGPYGPEAPHYEGDRGPLSPSAAAKDPKPAKRAGIAHPRPTREAGRAQETATAKTPATKAVTNRPLTLGEVIEMKGVKYRSIRHRDGSIAEHQTDNYIWRCPTCLRRLRDASCVGPKDGAAHKAVKAPEGYRASDRIVK